MTLFQAILLGGVYWMEAYHFGPAIRNITTAPLSVVVLVGLIMGDLPTAMKVSVPVCPAHRSAMTVWVVSVMCKMERARVYSTLPASVSEIRRGPRTTSCTPNSSSNSLS